MINDYCLSSQEDIYLYFQTITELKVKSVLDVGMTLKRFGALDRNIANLRLPDEVRLTGVDIFPHWKTDVYKNVYDEIIPMDKYLEMNATVKKKNYELAMMLYLRTIYSEVAYAKLMKKTMSFSPNVMVSDNGTEGDYYGRYGSLQQVAVGGNNYYLIT